MTFPIRKYPRTPHLAGSRLQAGDEDLSQVSFEEIKGKHLVIEEKIDGANCGLSFDEDGKLLLQSRGHYLTGGGRELHYDLFKQWATAHQSRFYQVLGSRYILYGEWMYAKHRIYYDALPSYFMEFDIFDRERQIYLDTAGRRTLTEQLPICSVPVLGDGCYLRKEEVLRHLGRSHYIGEGHLQTLRRYCEENGLDPMRVLEDTDPSDQMEGLYLKVEENGCVVQRLKYVRAGYAQRPMTSTQDWLHQAVVPNQLALPLSSMFEG